LQQDFAHAGTAFNVPYIEGEASNRANHNKHRIIGSCVGAVNAFVTRNSDPERLKVKFSDDR